LVEEPLKAVAVLHPRIAHHLLAYCTAGVLLAGIAALLWNVSRDGIGAAYTDPVGHIRAVDEALYVDAALRMVRAGDWLTPRPFGRLFFQKPPPVYWFSALSMKLLGMSLFALRLPEVLFGAAGAAAVFLWCAKYRSILQGLLAAAMLLTCPVYLTMSHIVDTSILAAGCIALAMTAVALDPQLERSGTWIWTGVFTGAAILAKSVAGAVPLVALAAYWMLVPSKLRPPLARLAASAGMAVLIAAPWHVYQLFAHPQWFWAEYVDMQLLNVGMHAERNGLFNQAQTFYAQRLWQLDPVLTLYAAAGIAGAIWALRSRDRLPELLALCWTAVTIVALASYQAKFLTYVVMLLPPLCILGGLCIPRLAILPVALLLILKTQPVSPPLEGAKAMRAYYELRRDAELIAAETNDDLYSATLPLRHVRYAAVDPSHTLSAGKPYYAALGIVLTSDEFLALPTIQATYERRLREWGENSSEPIGTAIMLTAPADLTAIIRARPDSDFYIPAAWSDVIAAAEPTHSVSRYGSDRVFLLSRTAGYRQEPLPPLPARW
jgi:hypothetical protein